MLKKIKILIILIICFLLFLLAINNYGIWTDETFTLNMIKNTFIEIPIKEKQLDGTAFYMLFLKLFVTLFRGNTPKMVINLSRVFSIIPIVILLFFGDRKISKLYSEKHGLTFILSIFVSNIIYYSFEIRVYSWTILFVTLAFIYFLYINKNYDQKNWNMFIICSSLAFWLHKISVIPLIYLYVYLFIKSFKCNSMKLFFKNAIYTIILCSPWVIWAVYMNIDKISETYISGAILPIFSYSKITESIIFPFSTGYLTLSLLFIVFIAFIFFRWLFINIKDIDKPTLYGVFVLPLTIITLMLIAYISNHDYYPKYMLPSLGIFFTSISLFISEDKKYKQFIIILCAFNLITYFNTFVSEQKSKEGFKELEKYMENEIKDETIIFNFDYGKYIIEYYQFDNLKDNNLIWDSNFIKKDNSLYLIQSYELDEYFNNNEYIVLKEFNISNDSFSLCKLVVQ